jgi:hypothetical protein
MSVSLRTERVDVFSHSTTATKGRGGATYTRVPSAEADGQWWAQKAPASARERGVAAQLQQEIDTTFEFGMEAEAAITPDGKIRHGAEWFSIVGILKNDRTQVIIVNAVRVSDEPDPASVVE